MTTDCVTVLVSPWFVLIGAYLSSLRLWLIGGFQSLSFRLEIVRLGTGRLLCCLIVGIHASGIPVDVVRVKSYVNSLFIPTGVPMWSRSIKVTSSQSG